MGNIAPNAAIGEKEQLVNAISVEHDLVEDFREKGFVKLAGLLTPACIAILRDEALRYLAASEDSGTTYGSEFSRLTYGLGEREALQAICTSTPFRRTVVGLIGNPLIMTDAQAFELKKKKAGFAWHYDSLSFRYIRPADPGYSLWIPLDRIRPQEHGGGMAYVPEDIFSARMNFQLSSLLSGKLMQGASIDEISASLSKIFETPSTLTALLEEQKHEDAFELGDALLFRKSVWHRSTPLTPAAPDSRLAIVIRFLDWRARLDHVMFEGETETGGGVGMGADWGRPTQTTYGGQFVDIKHGDEIRSSKFCGPII